MAFKIAFCAGHHMGNPKGVPVYMGLGNIREWTLNDQVARHFARAALSYEDVSVLRTDDSTGKTLIDIPERCAAANAWGADLYLDIHHNGGIGGGDGGGVCAFSQPGEERGRQYRDAIYEAVIAAGGLKGNRASPLIERNFDTMRYAEMPAVLVEYGFMDSRTDAPVIVTDAYSKLAAEATMAGIAKVAGLKKREEAEELPQERQIYRIRTSWENAASQVGAFVDLERAKNACPVGYSVYDAAGREIYRNREEPQEKVEAEPAQSFTKSLAGTYRVSSFIGLKLRTGAGTGKTILETMANGSEFICYGYHTGDWLYGVAESGRQGFCHKSLLKK